jgi:hypothetical protein
METTALDRMADEGGLGVGELYFHLFKVKIGDWQCQGEQHVSLIRGT